MSSLLRSRFMSLATSITPSKPKTVLTATRAEVSKACLGLSCKTLFNTDQTSPKLEKKFLTPVRTGSGVWVL